MRVLFLSNLYPNTLEPTRATFNRQKIAALSKHCEITVVAPILWFPFKFLLNKKEAAIPFEENIDGLKVYHPKVFYFPKFFRFLYGFFYYTSIVGFVMRLRNNFSFDIIFSSWVYPDGYCAMRLAKKFRIPYMVEALGSDINIYTKTTLRRIIIKQILRRATKIITVSKDLKRKIMQSNIPEQAISIVYAGINHKTFYPMDKTLARKQVNVSAGKVVIFVGNLVKIKGIEYLLKAIPLSKNKDWKLYIIGEGELRGRFQKVIAELGLEERVFMPGMVAHDKLCLWLNVSDMLCLPSFTEGVPNVVLEAMACGLPVVASRLPGIIEVTDDLTAILSEPGNSCQLASNIDAALVRTWDRDYIHRKSLDFDWDVTAQELFKNIQICVA
ncbi:MAG: glycosyltransferase [Candidatus Omnitrophota bacterium]